LVFGHRLLRGFKGTGKQLEDLLEEVHEVSVNLTLVLIGFHVAGVIVESFLHKENLVIAMFTGRKRA
jgi:cytochrome b